MQEIQLFNHATQITVPDAIAVHEGTQQKVVKKVSLNRAIALFTNYIFSIRWLNY